jgi:hypothetical protein
MVAMLPEIRDRLLDTERRLALAEEAIKIKDELKDTATAGGPYVFEGNLFKSTVIEANRKVTDWKAIAKVCNVPDEVVIAHTSITAVFSVKTTSR